MDGLGKTDELKKTLNRGIDSKATSGKTDSEMPRKPSSETSLSRRKTIDRRDPDVKTKRVPVEDRRKQGRRRSTSANNDEKTATQQDKDDKLLAKCHRLMMTCEPVTRLNYATLAMDYYPSNEAIARSTQVRDYWLISAVFSGFIFFLGLIGLIQAWFAGIAAGLCLLSVMFGFTSLRSYISRTPLLSEVTSQRRRLEKDAINHIHYLEGQQNLAFRCAALVEYNQGLNRQVFAGLIKASKAGNLIQVLRSKKHIRLYLLYIIEAQKAFKRLEKIYVQTRAAQIDDRVMQNNSSP
jgi:hypothetical protein